MSYRSKSLLACCIPDLHFNIALIDDNAFGCELDTNGWFGLLCKLVSGISAQ